MAQKTTYEDVYSRFLQKIEDTDLSRLDEEAYSESMNLWLHSAIAMMELDGVNLNNDYTQLNDNSESFMHKLDNIEIEVISLFMVCAWYDAKINSIEHVLLFVGANGEKWTDQINHMKGLQSARNDFYIRANHAVRNYNYKNNTYFE